MAVVTGTTRPTYLVYLNALLASPGIYIISGGQGGIETTAFDTFQTEASASQYDFYFLPLPLGETLSVGGQ